MLDLSAAEPLSAPQGRRVELRLHGAGVLDGAAALGQGRHRGDAVGGEAARAEWMSFAVRRRGSGVSAARVEQGGELDERGMDILHETSVSAIRCRIIGYSQQTPPIPDRSTHASAQTRPAGDGLVGMGPADASAQRGLFFLKCPQPQKQFLFHFLQV